MRRMGLWCLGIGLSVIVACSQGRVDEASREPVGDWDELLVLLEEADAAEDDEEFLALAEQGLSIEPYSPRARALLAYALVLNGDLDRALREIETALDEAEEIDPKLIAGHAFVLASRGEYEAASREIGRLAELEPAPTVPRHEIDKADLAHGEAQVASMLDDQPTLTDALDEVPGLRDWAVRMFAGEMLGQRIYWKYSVPSGRNSLHLPPSATHEPAIGLNDRRFENGKEVGDATFEQMWSSLAFEAFRILGPSWVDMARYEANASGDDAELPFGPADPDHDAKRQRRIFYADQFLVWAGRGGFDSDPDLWDVMIWP